MRHAKTLAIAACGLAFAANLFAAQAAKPAKAAAEHAAVGKIGKYDAATKMLTITTTKGEESFALASNASIREGSKTMAAADLEKLTGRSAKVRYTETGGTKTAHSVMVRAAAKTMAKPSPRKTTSRSIKH